MKFKFYITILSFIAFSCNNRKIKLTEVDILEIKQLDTDEQKNNYLLNLWHQDQHFRNGEESAIISQFGYLSKEHKKWNQQFENQDNEVFQKLELYLIIHAYPSKPSSYDELALNSFPIIIGHNHRYNSQKRLLPYLYDAYKKDLCPLDDIVWILGEMYESKHQGKRHDMPSPRFTTEDEFNELVKKLNLNLTR